MTAVRVERGVAATTDRVFLDGTALSTADVGRIADGRVAVGILPAVLDRLSRRRMVAKEAAALPAYGRTTGVGANRSEAVSACPEHGMRLLRSHASGIGNILPEPDVRAMLAVRANQALSGGGLQPAITGAMVAALNAQVYPEVHEHGAVGTGDLGPLAELGLALAGEARWAGAGAPPDPVAVEEGEALALISSNALTVGQAALAASEMRGLLCASISIAALTLLAVDGSTEPFAPEVHAARPHDGASRVAEEMLRLLGGKAVSGERIQDPFGLRCFPQVHGPALDAAADLESVLTVELNAATENPLITSDGGAVIRHHGGFHTAQLALALDTTRLAVLSTAQLSAGRLAMLTDPGMTGLRPFLASGPSGGSGIMLLEYGAGSALAELRAAAFPATLGHIVLSGGAEEHAGFAPQAVRQTRRAADAYRLVLACELVAAVRAHRLRGTCPAQPVYERACRVLDPDTRERPLSADVAAAATLVDEIARAETSGWSL